MKIEIFDKFYDYCWRIHNSYFTRNFYNPNDVNITTQLLATDIHGKKWELLDNGNRYDNEIYQNSHSRYDLILETFIMDEELSNPHNSMSNSVNQNIIFRLSELEPNFNPEEVDTIILSRNQRKKRREHYVGFAGKYLFYDYTKSSKFIKEDPFLLMGIRCEMRSRDKMFHWLNKNNPMNSDDYVECCQKQTQIIPLNNKTKDDAIKELNDAINNEIAILELNHDLSDILNVIERAKKMDCCQTDTLQQIRTKSILQNLTL